MIAGRVINGVYVSFVQKDEESGKWVSIEEPDAGTDTGRQGHAARMRDYYKGVKPSDLSRLDNRQLYTASVRLHESLSGNVGTKSERANAAEALQECYRERSRRRMTIR